MPILIAILLLIAPTTAETCAVNRSPPTVARIMFDPKHPPSNMPTLNPHESALTQFHFDCRASVERDESGTITRVRFECALEDRIYLPLNATLALRTHEEAHRAINERLYEAFVDFAAREIAKDAMKHADAKEMRDMIERDLGHAVRDRFVAEASRAGDRFDEITHHGQNDEPVASAIERALAQVK